MANLERRPFERRILRGVEIFQALTALLSMLVFPIYVMDNLFYPGISNYYVLASGMVALIAAGIIFIICVQCMAAITSLQNLALEAIKLTLATGLWLWFILDSAFGPWRDRYGHHPDVDGRVKRAALGSIPLAVLFYPPLVYAYFVWRTRLGEETLDSGGENSVEKDEATERTPLLPQEDCSA